MGIKVSNQHYSFQVTTNDQPSQKATPEMVVVFKPVIADKDLIGSSLEKWDAVYAYFERAWSSVFEGMKSI